MAIDIGDVATVASGSLEYTQAVLMCIGSPGRRLDGLSGEEGYADVATPYASGGKGWLPKVLEFTGGFAQACRCVFTSTPRRLEVRAKLLSR